MSFEWIIIDGNNLLHHGPRKWLGVGDFDSARNALVRELDQVAGELAGKTTVVFDGGTGGTSELFKTMSVEVVFSGPGATADGVIERMVAEAPTKKDVMVVTSDRVECNVVEASGATAMSCRAFLEFFEECQQNVASNLKRRADRLPGNTLADFFPE